MDVLARLRLNQLDLTLNPTAFPTRRYNLQEVSTICSEHFMLGVASAKGHALINHYRHATTGND